MANKSFEPTAKDRATVKAMAAYGIPQEDISKVIGISEPTLRKYFWQEIDTASAEANAKVAETLFRVATQGTGKEAITAAIFWLKCRAGWREAQHIEPPGKRAMDAEAAEKAATGRFATPEPPAKAALN